jgi:hypothetical protein
MDIPANREDPGCTGRCCSRISVNEAGVAEPAARLLDTWPFSPDLRHFRSIMAAVKLKSIDIDD